MIFLGFSKLFFVRPSVPGGPAGGVRPSVPGGPAGGTQFGTGILTKGAMSKGGVHKLQIFGREKYKEFFQKSSA